MPLKERIVYILMKFNRIYELILQRQFKINECNLNLIQLYIFKKNLLKNLNSKSQVLKKIIIIVLIICATLYNNIPHIFLFQ